MHSIKLVGLLVLLDYMKLLYSFTDDKILALAGDKTEVGFERGRKHFGFFFCKSLLSQGC